MATICCSKGELLEKARMLQGNFFRPWARPLGLGKRKLQYEGGEMENQHTLQIQAVVFLLGVTASNVLNAADVNGTSGNDILFLQGSIQPVNQVITNPFSGESITLSDDYFVNSASYDGLDGIDSLLMTNIGDLLFLEDPAGVQWLWNIERLLAGSGGDVLHLASTTISLGDLVIVGGASGDIIWSNVGNDTIDGQRGDDQIHGGPGNDLIYGNDGDDTLFGGLGSDEIYLGAGTDIANGGPGEDVFVELVDAATDLISGGADDDLLEFPWASTSVTISPSSDPNYQLDITRLDNGIVEVRLRDVEFAEFSDGPMDLTALLVTSLDCNGFSAPFTQNLTLKNKSKKTIPVKISLTDKDGLNIGASNIPAPPVINVNYSGTVFGSTPEDDEDLLTNGSANDGNVFSYDVNSQEWIYLLGTKQFSQAGVYEVTVQSGDNTEYLINDGNNCQQTFTRLP